MYEGAKTKVRRVGQKERHKAKAKATGRSKGGFDLFPLHAAAGFPSTLGNNCDPSNRFSTSSLNKTELASMEKASQNFMCFITNLGFYREIFEIILFSIF